MSIQIIQKFPQITSKIFNECAFILILVYNTAICVVCCLLDEENLASGGFISQLKQRVGKVYPIGQ